MATMLETSGRSALVVDDESSITELVSTALSARGFECRTATNGVEALNSLAECEADLVVTDVRMPGMDGLDLLDQIRVHHPDTSVILLTGSAEVPVVVRALRSGACDFLTKPFTLAELRERVDAVMEKRRQDLAIRAAQAHQEWRLEQMAARYRALTEGILRSLAATLDTKHPETRAHSERVALRAANLASEIGLAGEDVQAIYAAGLLHDVGKVAVDRSVLNKVGRLDEREFEQIKAHPVESARIVEPVALSPVTLDAIRHHHERYDGRGYPDGLAGDRIPLGARVLAVCDAFDAMTNDRAYRTALSYEEGFERLREGKGKQWDPDLVDRFCAIAPE
jgi:putative nucleotidyltransferase with HDIG domain